VLNIGGYSEEHLYVEDYELWTRLAEKGKIIVLPAYFTIFRYTSESITGKFEAEQELNAAKVAQRQIERLINEKLDLADILELKNFWVLFSLPQKSLEDMNVQIKKIYKAFLRNQTNRFRISCQLRALIGKQFFCWTLIMAIKKRFLLSFKCASIALFWHPLSPFYLFFEFCLIFIRSPISLIKKASRVLSWGN
jgi:hypothetical protein